MDFDLKGVSTQTSSVHFEALEGSDSSSARNRAGGTELRNVLQASREASWKFASSSFGDRADFNAAIDFGSQGFT
jgi:hypothetical protein